MTESLATALARGPVVLDGGLSTELERCGHDVSSALWSARLLRDDPEAIIAAHRAFFDAGARIATTASYQASFEGFAAAGVDARDAADLMARSVRLARAAAELAGLSGSAWVAASVGPFGATRADGSEYTGSYVADLGVDGLREFHRRRLEVLAGAAPDVLACETIPAAAEVEALLGPLEDVATQAWISLTTVMAADGSVRTRTGERAEDVFAMMRGHDQIVAVGVNCVDPQGVHAAIQAAITSGKPVLVYPNSGEKWDARARKWRGAFGFEPALVEAWLAGGAAIIGGCCRIGPEQLRGIARVVNAER